MNVETRQRHAKRLERCDNALWNERNRGFVAGPTLLQPIYRRFFHVFVLCTSAGTHRPPEPAGARLRGRHGDRAALPRNTQRGAVLFDTAPFLMGTVRVPGLIIRNSGHLLSRRGTPFLRS